MMVQERPSSTALQRQVGWFAVFAGAPFCLEDAPTAEAVLRHYQVADDEVHLAVVSAIPFAQAYGGEYECEVCGRLLTEVDGLPPGGPDGTEEVGDDTLELRQGPDVGDRR